jgi:hypothetical protein
MVNLGEVALFARGLIRALGVTNMAITKDEISKLIKTLEDFSEMFRVLLDDVVKCHEKLNEDDSQFWRRTYIELHLLL